MLSWNMRITYQAWPTKLRNTVHTHGVTVADADKPQFVDIARRHCLGICRQQVVQIGFEIEARYVSQFQCVQFDVQHAEVLCNDEIVLLEGGDSFGL